MWQEQIESGQYSSLEELAQAIGMDRTLVSRIIRLTSLSPSIVERILAGDEPEGISLRVLRKGIPLLWCDQ
jgi:DNA-binding MarR family transcriptional regulator